MKDIDFDELDRAVGSAIGTAAPAEQVNAADMTATAPLTTPASVVPAPSPAVVAPSTLDDSKPDAEASTEQTDTPGAPPVVKPSVSPARKRGQFLDMVHPSANMRKPAPPPTSMRKTIKPLTTIKQDDPTAMPATGPAPVVNTSPSDSQAMGTAATANDSAPQDSAWPDPIDLAPVAAHTPSIDHETATEEAGVEAAQTPFVSDAKVDKRPLGAFAADEAAEPAADDTAVNSVHSSEPDLLGPEFTPELNSVEAAGVPQAEEESTGFTGGIPKGAISPELVETESTDTVTTPEPAAPVASEPTDQPAAPVVAAVEAVPTDVGTAQSIPQQYKTTDTPKQDESQPLFNNEEYHQPLLAEGKKKSKKVILIVLLLVVLLVIGGVLGYFAYTIGI